MFLSFLHFGGDDNTSTCVTLHFPQGEDAGNYMCVATNDAGVVERSVTLTLQSKSHRTFRRVQNLTSHDWKLEITKFIIIRIMAAFCYTLVCASSCFSSAQSEAFTSVVPSSGAPTITVEPADTVVDAGSTIVLNCQAEGEPTPTVEWSRQGRPLQGLDRLSSLSNGSLRISSAQKEDTAEYECVARNLLGSVLVRVTLTVRGEHCIMGMFFFFFFTVRIHKT